MIEIRDHPEGCTLAIRAQPGARRNEFKGEQAGRLKVAVTAPAQDGRANQALLRFLRESLDLKRSQVELIAGNTSRQKIVLIRGLSCADFRELLNRMPGGA